jgi:hypothetical protein
MNLLYKDVKDLTYTVDITQENGLVKFQFWADCGKHGMLEPYVYFDMPVKVLLTIFNSVESD